MEIKKKLFEVNIMEDKKLVWGLNILVVVLLVPFALLFGKIAFSFIANIEQKLELTLSELWIGMVTFLLLIVVHEVIHGLFFKLFCPENPVKYGIKWKSGMAYATSPGSLYTRMQMLVISLAPFVVISFGLTMVASFEWMDVSIYILLATMHAACCAGDFYYAYLLLVKYGKGSILVEDNRKWFDYISSIERKYDGIYLKESAQRVTS